jgi:hypothetical protein
LALGFDIATTDGSATVRNLDSGDDLTFDLITLLPLMPVVGLLPPTFRLV